MQITLKSGDVLIFDEEDEELVMSRKWHSNPSGNKVYARSKKHGQFAVLHRLIMGAPLVDHINGNGLDNRRANLRVANKSQNAANSKKRSKDRPFKGVGRNGRNWGASLMFQGKLFHLGTYENPYVAALAYDIFAVQVFGEFANLNTIGA